MSDAPVCEWFLMCDNPATMLVAHPILGKVPTCGRCVAMMELQDRAEPVTQ